MISRCVLAGILVAGLLVPATVRGRVAGNASANGKTGSATIIQHFLIIGQSLAAGEEGSPGLSTSPGLYNNLRFAGGVFYPSSRATVVSITEASNRETISSGFAHQLSALQIAGGVPYPPAALLASWGVDGTVYSGLKKGTQPYTDSLAGVTSAATIYPAPILRVPAILVVHGEGDGDTATYGGNLTEWQSDYQSDIQAITGQATAIPFLYSQMANSSTFLGMLPNYEASPSTMILVGPKYFLPYHDNGTHPLNTTYRTLGEYYGKAYYHAVVLGDPWSPLRPSTITRSGVTVTVQLTGQVGDIVNGCTAPGAVVTDPDGAGCTHCPLGFEWSDSTSSAYVSSVTISDATAGIITVTLNTTPTGNSKALRYAYSSTGVKGVTTGRRGCIRDSDTTSGVLDGVTLQNWLVHFNKSVN